MAPRRRAWQWAQCGRWKGWGTALAASRAGAGGRRRVGGVPGYMRAASGRGAKWCEWAGSAMPGRPAAHEGRRRRSASGGGRCRGGGLRGRRPTAPARCAGPAGCPCSRLLCAPPRCAALRCAPRGRRVRRRRRASGRGRSECGPVAAARQAGSRSLRRRSCRSRQTRRRPLAGADRRGRARYLPPCAGELGPHAPRGPAAGGKPAALSRAALRNPGAARRGAGPAPAAHDASAADLRQSGFRIFRIPASWMPPIACRTGCRESAAPRRGSTDRPIQRRGICRPMRGRGPPGRQPARLRGFAGARCESGRGIVKSARDPAAAGE